MGAASAQVVGCGRGTRRRGARRRPSSQAAGELGGGLDLDGEGIVEWWAVVVRGGSFFSGFCFSGVGVNMMRCSSLGGCESLDCD